MGYVPCSENAVKMIDMKKDAGPFDIIGDIHGCYDELCVLLKKLGYTVDEQGCDAVPPEGRRVVFVGDTCDRGPKNIECFMLVMNMIRAGRAYCVIGNHDSAVAKKLRGIELELAHKGLDETLEQLNRESKEFVSEVDSFLGSLVSHYIFDDGRLVVAHAGLKEEYQGQETPDSLEFCIYGNITGEVDDYGRYIRFPWESEYRGKALVVFGHFPSPEVKEAGNTICIDTGLVFGNKLTCLRYPEKEIVQVNAEKEYYIPVQPIGS